VALLAFALWMTAGIRRTDPERGTAILDAPLGILRPRLIEPGWHLIPPGLLRLSFYPVGGDTLSMRIGADGPALVTSEGTAIVATASIQYRVETERILDVHRRLGPELERDAIGPWVLDGLREAVAGSSYTEISGARTETLRLDLARSLDERFREFGLILLSCDVRGVQIRDDRLPEDRTIGPIPGTRVLLIGLDGADWNILDPLMKAGRLPHLSRLVKGGVRARLRTITPMLSPVVWTSIATGVVPSRHGIVDFVATMGPERKRVPVRSSLRKVKAIWNVLSEQNVRVGVVGWWATFPAERVNGFIVTDRVAHQLFGPHRPHEVVGAGKVYPPQLEEVVQALRIAPESITTRQVSRYIRLPAEPGALPADQEKLIDDFKTLLAAGDTYGRIALELEKKHAPDFLAVYFEGTDVVGHLFMPYASPPLEGIDRQAAKLFGRTVDAYYRHVDEEIGRILRAVGPETAVIVCSDHGFKTVAHRPLTDSRIGHGQAADWHRKYGVLILHGPQFRRSSVLEEASILDVTPTILTLFGLPVAEDWDGRPIVDGFTPEFLQRHPVLYRPTYEGTVIAGGHVWEESQSVEPEDPEGDRELKEKLESLGYLRQDTANSHNNRGMLLLRQGKQDEAIREFEQAIEASEDFAIAHINIARANMQKGDFEAAVSALERHLTRRPRSKTAENLMGNIRMEQARLDEAEAHFLKALSYEPNFTEARNSLGILYDQVGRTEEALAEFQRAVEIDPDYAEPHNNIGLIHKKEGRLDEAIEYFKKAIAADAEFAGSYSNLALTYEEMGKFDTAEKQFREALRRDPENATVRANYGGLLYVLNRLEVARRELSRAISIDPSHATAHNNLGAVYGKLGRPEEEIDSYREAVRLEPEYADAHHNLGLAFLKRGRAAEGEEELRRVLEVDASYASAYVTLGGSFLSRGAEEEAVEILSRGARLLPNHAVIQALLARALLRVGRQEEAVAAIERSLSLDPEQPELRAKLQELQGEGE
jgi:tetratricopeptide (TPR) repeat protein/predicted AlkP superfamily phosphohydrolase/phosphomutase